MPAYTTDALILRTYKLGESDRIVVFLTRDRGKKRGVGKNARQSRRRFGGGLEPMTCGRVAYLERERRDLVRLDYVVRPGPLYPRLTATRSTMSGTSPNSWMNGRRKPIRTRPSSGWVLR